MLPLLVLSSLDSKKKVQEWKKHQCGKISYPCYPPTALTGENSCSDSCFTETGGKITSGFVLLTLDTGLTGWTCSSTSKSVKKSPGSSTTFSAGWSLSVCGCSFSFFSASGWSCESCFNSKGIADFSVSIPNFPGVNLSTCWCNPAAFSHTDCRCTLISRSRSSSSWRGSRPLDTLVVTSSLKTASDLVKWCRRKYSKMMLIVSDIFKLRARKPQESVVGVEAKASTSPTFDVTPFYSHVLPTFTFNPKVIASFTKPSLQTRSSSLKAASTSSPFLRIEA